MSIEGELELSEVEKLSSVVRGCIAGPDSVRKQGEYFVAIEPNSFGLPSVDSCPGSTDACERVCYATDSERRTATYNKLQRNFSILQHAETVDEMVEQLDGLMSRYHERAEKLGVNSDERRFRIHWSGDFYSTDYALAWRRVIENDPDTKYWTYTRSFQQDVNVVPILACIPNLDLFLSVDEDNAKVAAQVARDNPGVRISYLVDYEEEAEPLIQIMGRGNHVRNLTCPENIRNADGSRRLPVISKHGGACSRCTYCIDKPNSWDVIFLDEGEAFRPQPSLPFAETVPVEIKTRRRGPRTIKETVGRIAVAEKQATLF